MANNARLVDLGVAANLRRASAAGRRQAVLAAQALAVLGSHPPAAHRDRWMRALAHRVTNPEATLAELGQTGRG